MTKQHLVGQQSVPRIDVGIVFRLGIKFQRIGNLRIILRQVRLDQKIGILACKRTRGFQLGRVEVMAKRGVIAT
jgi:hypothetical protein